MHSNKIYFKNIGTLFSGSVFATAIPLCLAPILTRQYTPAEFGVFAFFVAIADVILVFATLRISHAIVIPNDKCVSWNIFTTCLFLTVIFSVLVFTLSTLIPTDVIVWVGGGLVTEYLPYVAPYVFICSLYTSVYAWHNRNDRYKTIAFAKVLSISLITCTSILFGYLQFGPLGLILGLFIGKLASVIFMSIRLWAKDKKSLNKPSASRVVGVIYENKNFPLFSVPAGLFNMLSHQMPVFVLAAFFGSTAIGFYDLSQRVLSAPTILLGTAVQDVFKVKASKEYAEDGTCKKAYVLTLITLVIISSLFFIPLFYFAPKMFGFVFGEEWRIAGIYTKILIPFIAVRFIASSLSYTLLITNNQKSDMFWQICLAVCVFVTMYIGSKTGEPETAITYLSITGAVMYIFYFLKSLSVSQKINPNHG